MLKNGQTIRGQIVILKVNKQTKTINYQGQKLKVYEGDCMIDNKTYKFSKIVQPNNELGFKDYDIIEADYRIERRWDANRKKIWENLRIGRVYGIVGKFDKEDDAIEYLAKEEQLPEEIKEDSRLMNLEKKIRLLENKVNLIVDTMRQIESNLEDDSSIVGFWQEMRNIYREFDEKMFEIEDWSKD